MLFPLVIQTPRGSFDILDAMLANDFLRPDHRYLVLTLRQPGSRLTGERCFYHAIPAAHITNGCVALGLTRDVAGQLFEAAVRRSAELVLPPEFIPAGSAE